MSAIFDAHGTSWDFSGVEVNPNTFTLPGWSREEIETTTHGNTSVTTKVLSALKDYSQLVVNVDYDPSEHNQISTGNQNITVTGADGSTLSLWADLQQVGDPELAANNSDKPTYDLTLTVTNTNATGAESEPTYSSGS